MIEMLEDESILIIAGHRGYMSHYPENTLLSFQKALELGVEMLELDLRLSKDGVLMVLHDETLERTTDGFGKISDYTVEQLKQFDASKGNKGTGKLSIPTFEEFCEFLKLYPDILLNVEIKPSNDAKEVADKAIAMLRDYGFLSRCVFTSFDAAIVTYISEKYQLKTQGFPGEKMFNFVPGSNGTYSNMWAVGISMNLLTPEIVKEFREKNILAWCYCPDNEVQVNYALQCGASLMTCNNPKPALQIRDNIKNKNLVDL
jgi:glycerophosphoryl diester phosphodiesterase